MPICNRDMSDIHLIFISSQYFENDSMEFDNYF